MYAFTYVRPASLTDAIAQLQGHPEARPLSGGMTLIPTLKQRLAAPTHLVDLTALPELCGIAFDGKTLRIGAATPHAQVAASAEVARAIPALARLAGMIADPQVRNRGTLGGSIANNDPAADYPAAVLGLDATVVTSARRIPAAEFFTGMFETALAPDELVVAVEFERPDDAEYIKYRHAASGYAVVGVFISRRNAAVRVAVTGAAPSVFRWHEAEAALAERFDPAALDALSIDPGSLSDDVHASSAYRANLVKVYAGRAIAAMAARGA